MAAGKTSEECRENLKMAIEDWIVLGLRFDLPIPPIEWKRRDPAF